MYIISIFTAHYNANYVYSVVYNERHLTCITKIFQCLAMSYAVPAGSRQLALALKFNIVRSVVSM